jgi:hypothetical protein
MITLTENQKRVASKVLTWDTYSKILYKPEDLIGVKEFSDGMWHFLTRQGLHPIHKETFFDYKANFPEFNQQFNQPVTQPVTKPQYVSNDSYYGDLVDLVPDTAIADANQVIPVASSSSNTVYLVAPQQQSCTCKGFQYRHHCKHLHQVNKENLVKTAEKYGFEVSENKIHTGSFNIYKKNQRNRLGRLGQKELLTTIYFDKTNNCYWYRRNQLFNNPVHCFEAWAKNNYKQIKPAYQLKVKEA